VGSKFNFLGVKNSFVAKLRRNTDAQSGFGVEKNERKLPFLGALENRLKIMKTNLTGCFRLVNEMENPKIDCK
jgi:hypothetical protein